MAAEVLEEEARNAYSDILSSAAKILRARGNP